MTALEHFGLRTGLPYVRYRGLKSAWAQLLRGVDTSERFFMKGIVFIHPATSNFFAFAYYLNVFRPFMPKYVTIVYTPAFYTL